MRHVRSLLIPVALAGLMQVAAAQTYPTKPVTVVVPYPPGGATDIVARIAAQGLWDELGQSFVVDNTSGGAGMIGLETVANASADGYTLLVPSTGPATISPLLYKNGAFRPLERLEPIVQLASSPAVLVVRNGLPAKTVRALIDLSKKEPGALNMASAGNGSLQRLIGEYLQEKMGIKWLHIPYRGSAPALSDVMAERVDVMVDVIPSAAPFVQSGKMRALAVMAPKRSSQLPDVPTLEELGFPGYDFSGWHALLAPKGTPPDIIARLNAAANKILAKPDIQEKLAKIGAQADGGTPELLRTRMEQDLENWSQVIKKAGITGE
jgi:tripartite-type tricarboxylate transporter receptor subunit TctC